MANESIVMASTSMLTSHGGPKAAMPVSVPPTSGEEQAVELGSVDSADKTSERRAFEGHSVVIQE